MKLEGNTTAIIVVGALGLIGVMVLLNKSASVNVGSTSAVNTAATKAALGSSPYGGIGGGTGVVYTAPPNQYTAQIAASQAAAAQATAAANANTALWGGVATSVGSVATSLFSNWDDIFGGDDDA